MRKSIPALTGIRGMAALLVVLFHLPTLSELPMIRNGIYGVDLFFLLSGFILYHVHHQQFEQLSWRAAKRFYLLRFLRVYPLHFSVLMVILASVVVFPNYAHWVNTNIPRSRFTIAGFFQTLTLTNRIGLPNYGEWNGPSWSLSSEALAYLFFPLLAVLLFKVRSSRVCIVSALGLMTLHCAAMWTNHQGVVRVLLAFPAGMALAKATHLRTPTRAGLIAVTASTVALGALSIDWLAPLSVFGFAGLIYALSVDTSIVARTLSSPPILFLGTISFSLYLTHSPLFMFVSWATEERVLPAALAALALAVGWGTYLIVEAPSHRYARLRSKRPLANAVPPRPGRLADI